MASCSALRLSVESSLPKIKASELFFDSGELALELNAGVSTVSTFTAPHMVGRFRDNWKVESTDMVSTKKQKQNRQAPLRTGSPRER